MLIVKNLNEAWGSRPRLRAVANEQARRPTPQLPVWKEDVQNMQEARVHAGISGQKSQTLGWLLTTCLVVFALPSHAFTFYNDEATWLAAAQQLSPALTTVEENFDNNRIHTPGLSFLSEAGLGVVRPGNGHVENNEWEDCLGYHACGLDRGFTHVNYAPGYIALGGDWDVNLTTADTFGMGTFFEDMARGCFGATNSGNQRYTGWCGYTADALQPGFAGWNTSTGSVTYTLDNLVLASDPVVNPEPGTGLLMLLGLAAFLAATWLRVHSLLNKRHDTRLGREDLGR